MKTIQVFIMLLFIAWGADCNAQDVDLPRARFGIKAGINLANLSLKNSAFPISPSTLVGPTGGFFATIPAGTNFSIQPELLYSMLGCKLATNPSAKFQFGYIVLPVLAKYTFNQSGFSAYLGPQIGVRISAKAKSGSNSEDMKDAIKSTDFAGVGGLEYMFPIGFTVSARYQLGFSNIVAEPDPGESIKNKAFTFTVGYSL